MLVVHWMHGMTAASDQAMKKRQSAYSVKLRTAEIANTTGAVPHRQSRKA